MELVFGMVGTVFDFFVDLGNRVDFLGLNLWQISFFFFMIGCIFRWLFPVVFAGEGDSGGGGAGLVFGGIADSVKGVSRVVKDNNKRFKENKKRGYLPSYK